MICWYLSSLFCLKFADAPYPLTLYRPKSPAGAHRPGLVCVRKSRTKRTRETSKKQIKKLWYLLLTKPNKFGIIQSQQQTTTRQATGREGKKMIGTYSTIDFDELLSDLQNEISRIRTEYRVHSKERADKIVDYNRMTTALLILKDIDTQ